MNRLRRILAIGLVVLAATALTVTLNPAPAAAQSDIGCESDNLYLVTPYGHLKMCFEVINDNGTQKGRPTVYSWENHTYTPQSGFVPVPSAGSTEGTVFGVGDTQAHPFAGAGPGVTGFGKVWYGTQWWYGSPYGNIGRWGSLDVSENPIRFHPSSDWEPLWQVA